jgi:DNA-directed RNA polymerase subunit RPC12/RpoP
MTSTFLHEDKNVPPDEAVERDAPPCAACSGQMWLVRVETKISDDGTRSTRQYECSQCGAKRSLQTTSKDISAPI